MTTGRRMEADAGTTLVELMVASSLFFIALTMFGLVLYVSQRTQIRDSEYSSVNDSVHVAAMEIDRQLRSGYVVAEPATLPGAADSVKIFTVSSVGARCVMWAIAPPTNPADPMAPQSLYTRTWDPESESPPTAFAAGSGWRVAATGIVKADPSSFVIGNASFGSVNAADVMPTLLMYLRLNASRDKRDGQEIEFQSKFTSRNTPRLGQDTYGLTTAQAVQGACG